MLPDDLTRLIVPGTDPDVVDAYFTLSERASDAIFGFEDEVAFVDIETTGFDPDHDAIIEVAAVIARGTETVDTFSTLVDPGREVPLEIVRLTGIGDDTVAGKPGPEAAALSLAAFVGGRDIVAHNAAFDRTFLTRAGGAAAFRGAWLDSLQVALIALPRLRSHRLSDLAAAFGAHSPSHRAADDVEALRAVWRVLLVALSDLPAGILAHIAGLAAESEWPIRSVIAHMAAGSRASRWDLKEARRDRVESVSGAVMRDAEEVECHCPDVEMVVGEFTRTGVAGRMYEGFEHRGEQARMARAVLEAFGSRTHVAIEAGTGVGKSVAYLVPAARFALENRVSVGVATKTNALMDQLIYSELPALRRALNDELEYVSLKGYEHYPCLRKVERFARELEDAEEQTIVTVAALLVWIDQSSWGDLDATNIHWRRDVRGRTSASIADCTRRRCRFYPDQCYLHGVRRMATQAHVVVTNHALLFRDVVAAGGILPPIRHWIIDEAHAAESEARKQLTLETSHAELRAALLALRASGGRGGVLAGVHRNAHSACEDVRGSLIAELARAEDAVDTCITLTDSLFDFVKDLSCLVPDGTYDACEVRIDGRVRETGAWATLTGVGSSLARKLEGLIESCRRLTTLLEEGGQPFREARADLSGLLSRVADQYAGLVTVLDGEPDEYVYSAGLDRRRNVTGERLTAAYIDVGQALADEFFPRTHSVVATSATIAAGDDFSHLAHAVGFDRMEPGSFSALRLASSYDFEKQMAVFVPNDIAPPFSPRYLVDLQRLLERVHLAMGGSTLTLFTNRRDMESLYRDLEPRLEAAGLSLLAQTRGLSAKRLRDEFIADQGLSLFATKSFWEGFDAKGDTLRCVVVPRLPFGRPTDPLAQEREEREGRAAWRRYALPEAVLELKQAAGRLIRSATDTGCLVIADVRVLQKGYGKEFLDSLPVRDVEVLATDAIAEEMARRFSRAG